ncbi:hypothetical protein MNV49_001767 [Pseudohyphozyma bogoriensis]|nr:hypothetical protein MNV49_001767 [Pseudohyphozyma bogoriensis]
MTDYKFEGWLGYDKTAVEGNMRWGEYTPQKWDENDIDIQVLYSGICGSDIHHLSEGWRPEPWPICCGHEIVGRVVRVGKESGEKFKLGDMVGVGAQGDSCRECHACEHGQENYCPKMTNTYSGTCSRGNAKGDKTWGGYSNYHRARMDFAFKIPDGLDPAAAAPMMCGGTTVYTPLKMHGAGTTAKDVGVVGVGGLGHFALLFAKAMGANVTAISHSESKKGDAEKMGATRFIASGTPGAFDEHKRSLDLIIITAIVGAAEQPLSLPPFPLLGSGAHIGGSLIGPPATIEEMLAFAAEKQIQPWIEKRPLTEANKAVVDMHAGKAKYRYVLINEANGATF